MKVLRAPDDGGGCWHCLLRFRPPAGQAIRKGDTVRFLPYSELYG